MQAIMGSQSNNLLAKVNSQDIKQGKQRRPDIVTKMQNQDQYTDSPQGMHHVQD